MLSDPSKTAHEVRSSFVLINAALLPYLVRSRVLFPPGTPRSLVKGAHLARSDVLLAATTTDSHVADDPDADAEAEAVDDAMEAVFYFTHSLPLLQRRWDETAAAIAAAATTTTDQNGSAGTVEPSAESSSPPSRPYGMLEFLQYPGETVFVPAGWLHAVVNLVPSVAVTQNFVPSSSSEAVSRSWSEAARKRPHMARRWRAQVERQRPDLLPFMPLDALRASSSSSLLSSERKPDLPTDDAALDPDSWYWAPSSSEEDEDEEEEEDADYR
jgi:hypothetical protein